MRATTSALKALPDSWVVLHDVRWPGRPFANIDHIAIGPSGVYVIDSKCWSGKVRLVDGVLRHNGRPRTREVLSAAEAAAAVSRRLPHLPAAWVTPVLCIVSSTDAAGWSGGAAVCHKANIVERLTSRPEVLSPEVVHSVVNDLRLQLHTDTPPEQQTLPSLARPRPEPAHRSSSRTALVAPVAGLALAATLALSPTIVSAVADGLGSLLSHTVDSGSRPDEAPAQDR